MRYIILDTETTGLYPQQGHRIIEVAGVELIGRRLTGEKLHYRLDPERDIDAAATEVHGMTWADLKGQPKFRDIAAEFAAFAQGAQWVIHNAPFDLAFLEVELERAALPSCGDIHAGVIDTLALARQMFPGKRNSLDALCERFGVDNAQRSLHGALLDARLLAEVYLAMTRGQERLTIDLAASAAPRGTAGESATSAVAARARGALAVLAPTPDEMAAHRAYLDALQKESKGRCLWLALEAEDSALPQGAS